MKIRRAHSYDHVEEARAELLRLPPSWRRAIEFVPWIILSSDVKPSYVGLLTDVVVWNGLSYDDVGGWAARPTDDCAGFGVHAFPPPYVYLNARAAWHSTVHEAAHMLEWVWHMPVGDFYRPDLAFDDYARTTPEEYMARSVEIFVDQWKGYKPFDYSRDDLARRDPAMFAYLSSKLQEEDHGHARQSIRSAESATG